MGSTIALCSMKLEAPRQGFPPQKPSLEAAPVRLALVQGTETSR
jgi:hypothetical protein